jgi:hypothetical protein
MAVVTKEKPTYISLNLMAGPTNKLKTVRAKLVGGIITYPGCDPNDPIIWFGSSGYALLDVPKKRYELFYDTTKKTLLRLESLGGGVKTDAITDLTKNFALAVKNTNQNMNANNEPNTAWKWGFGVVLVVILFALVIIYLMYTHVPSGAATSTQSVASVTQTVNKTLIHLPGAPV